MPTQGAAHRPRGATGWTTNLRGVASFKPAYLIHGDEMCIRDRTSAASTQSRARITVIALAKITGPARRSATRIASRRSAWWRNSSR